MQISSSLWSSSSDYWVWREKLCWEQVPLRSRCRGTKCRGSHCTRSNCRAIVLSSTQVDHSSLWIWPERARSNIGLPRKLASFFEIWSNSIWFLPNTLPIDFGSGYTVKDPSRFFWLYKRFISKWTKYGIWKKI